MYSLNCRTMTIGDRIKKRLRILGMTRGDLIRGTGASKGTVSQWISDGTSPSSRYINSVCQVLVCSPEYLLDGIPDEVKGDNISSVRSARGLVPLISKIQAGEWRQEEDEFQPGDAEEFLPCPRNHSQHTYALRVEGDSMTAPHGKSYPHGCIIYCDPEQVVSVASGDCVVARIKGEDEVTFKQYYKEGKTQLLMPLNRSFPTINDEFEIKAKIIGKWEDS
jgi:SOS-response transcriptional repressor LexA